METKSLFPDGEIQEWWRKEWLDMPEFVMEDMNPSQQIIISFRCDEDVEAFAKLIDQKLTYKTKSVWFPAYDREKPSDYIYESEL